jgi:hypothetical protein
LAEAFGVRVVSASVPLAGVSVGFVCGWPAAGVWVGAVASSGFEGAVPVVSPWALPVVTGGRVASSGPDGVVPLCSVEVDALVLADEDALDDAELAAEAIEDDEDADEALAELALELDASGVETSTSRSPST